MVPPPAEPLVARRAQLPRGSISGMRPRSRRASQPRIAMLVNVCSLTVARGRPAMRRLRVPLTILALALASPAAAQFWLFPGLRPQPAPQQPAPIPAPAPVPEPMAPTAPVVPREAPPPRPASLKAVPEDAAVDRDLMFDGRSGRLRMERVGRGTDFQARVTLPGTRISRPAEACTVALDDGAPLPLASLGRPEGLARFEVRAPACPIRFDVLDGGVRMVGPDSACVIEAADCRVEPRGIWGPSPDVLVPQAKAIEQVRGLADRVVRENYRALAARARPQEVRPIVGEQAAFSAEREQTCRNYAREGQHGFCNARFTEARAARLAQQLGLRGPDTSVEAPRTPRAPRPPGAAAGAPMPISPAFGSNEIR